MRAWARVLVIVMLLLSCLALHGLWQLAGATSPWPRRFLGGVARVAGVRVTLTGAPLPGPVLYVANHLSWIDILVIAGQTGSAFVAKADMAPWPVIGWLSTLNNSVYVNRDARLGSSGQVEAVRNALTGGQPLTIFPEGTTGDGTGLLPFRSSLLAAVAPPPPGVAVQPVAIDYGARAPIIAWTDAESVGRNALRIMQRAHRLPVTLHFLAPLEATALNDRKTITAAARAAIERALGLAESPSTKLVTAV